MQGILYEITINLLKEEDFLSETSFVDHAFIRDRADRITDTINRKEYLNEFKIWIETNEIGYFNNNDYSFVFTEKGKENYFRSKFHQFKESAEKLNGMNLNDFSTGSNDIEETVRVLNNLFYEEYRNYVSTEEGDITTFDEFVRYAEIEQNYYIGGILKYHY